MMVILLLCVYRKGSFVIISTVSVPHVSVVTHSKVKSSNKVTNKKASTVTVTEYVSCATVHSAS